jgi:hemoglobin
MSPFVGKSNLRRSAQCGKEHLMRKLVLSVVALAALVVAGCDSMNKDASASSTDATAMKNMSLYDRLGGQPAVTKVVDSFVARAAPDPNVNFTRKGIPGAEWDPTPENVAHLKQGLVDFITVATGGPNNYKGKSMKEAHKNMQITDAQFNAIAGDLKAALDDNKVPANLQKELLDIVGTTRKDIVTKM